MLLFNYGRLKRFCPADVAYSVVLKCNDEWQGRKRKHLLLHWWSTNWLQNAFVWSSFRDNNQLYMFINCDNKTLLMFQRVSLEVIFFCRNQIWWKYFHVKILSSRRSSFSWRSGSWQPVVRCVCLCVRWLQSIKWYYPEARNVILLYRCQIYYPYFFTNDPYKYPHLAEFYREGLAVHRLLPI
jgi:hypothetical protein